MVWVKEGLHEAFRGSRIAFKLYAYNKCVSFVRFFLQRFEQFNKNYKGLFGQEDGGSDEGSKEEWFNKKWGWYLTLDALSNSRVVDFDKILEFNVVFFLNMIAYYKDKQEYEKEITERERLKWSSNR